MKIIVSLVCLLLIAFSTSMFAQGTTVSIGSVTAQAGQSVNVPINVTNFTNIGAISLVITYNSTVLGFTGVTNPPSGVNITAGASGGRLALGWFDATATSPINIVSGKLVDLVFTYNGGTSPLVFDVASCEIVTDEAPPVTITATYTDGMVGAVGVKLTLGTLKAAKGSAINVPITAENFNKIGAVSLKISYDPAVLTFVDTVNSAAGVRFTYGASGGVLSLGWFDQSGRGVSIGNAKLVDLKFNYASGVSDVNFLVSQSELSDSAGGPVASLYVNGKVSPVDAEAVSVLLDNPALVSGINFLMHVNVRNFKSVGAVSLKINYNAAVLTFNGFANAVRTAFTANANAGVLTVAWFSSGTNTPITMTGKMLDLSFTYNGGTTALTFQESECEVADSVGTPQGVLYTNGNVTPFSPQAGWNVQTSDVSSYLYSVKAVSQTVAWAAGAGGVVLRTVNGGTTWTSVGGGAIGTSDIYSIDAVSADSAFVTTTPSATYIFRTTDGGASWAQVFTQAGGFIDAIKMFNRTSGIALGDPVGGKWTIAKTTDGGASWARIATEPAQVGTEAGTQNGLCVVGTTHIWFNSGAGGRIYRSTDGGATWASSTVSFAATSNVWFNTTKYGIASGSSTSTIARTADGGVTWFDVPVAGSGFLIAVAGSGVRDFWYARGSTVYSSNDFGFTFSQSYAGADSYVGLSFTTVGSSTYGWAVGTAGDIVGYFGTITDVKRNDPLPQVFDLAQNYPNPFNPSTTIEYSLPQRANVTLRIYDMLGQEVRTLATGVREAGNFKVVWDGRNNTGYTVSTGLYVYRIEASPLDGGNAFASFKKMLLLK